MSSIDPEEVYEAVRQIPLGAVISYGELAERIGRARGAARVVARILGSRPDNDAWLSVPADEQDIPWWRVARSDGTLLPNQDEETGHTRRWIDWARDQLAKEGVAFTNDGRIATLAGPRSFGGDGGRSSRTQRYIVPEPCWRHETVQYSCRDCAPVR